MTQGLQITGLRVTPPGADTPLVQLSAEVAPGQVLTVMGPSGSGKSTLLAALVGTLRPGFTVAGQITLNGRDLTLLPAEARRIGILFQDPLLFPHLSVAGNLSFALPRRLKGAARAARIAAALDEAGLAGFGPRDPATLSGGERSRVALMRTLLAEPEALLLDEPFARLDAGRREQIRAFTFATARAHGLPVILVTHDAQDAAAAGGPVIAPLPG
jgi:putative thiamine transport system ATP-binding protein